MRGGGRLLWCAARSPAPLAQPCACLLTLRLNACRVESECAEDGAELDAGEVHHYLTRVMYNRRNKFNPLWNQLVIAGTKDGKP